MQTTLLVTTEGSLSKIGCLVEYHGKEPVITSFVYLDDEQVGDDEFEKMFNDFYNLCKSKSDSHRSIELTRVQLLGVNQGVTIEDISLIHTLTSTIELLRIEACTEK